MTLPITGAGRRPAGLRGTRLGAAKDALTEWAIRRTSKASGVVSVPLMSPEASASVHVALSPDQAFERFTDGLGEWWPHEYTWSQGVLEAIGIEDGLCFERGPHGFTCHWGRVLAWEPPSRLVLSWQISPSRVPEPDPARASEVEVVFAEEGDGTAVSLVHRAFERHGEGGEDYAAAMGSEMGWPYILERYRSMT